MSFDPLSEHEISFEAASLLTYHYRESMQEGMHKGGYFSGASIKKILDQEGCVGIRIYYGLDRDEEQELVIVGVDENGNDQIGERFCCLDDYQPCPAVCSENNILNN
jgi:hypothetical protein